MSSSKGPSTLMDWRDITERLLDPQQRRAIVTKANTDDLQQLKTKNAFTKRKRRLLDQIRKNRNLAKNNNTQKADENSSSSTRSPNTSPRSSRCSELNFTNEDGVPSTPPPTLTPSNATLPTAAAAAANRSNPHRPPHQQHQQLPHQHPSTHPVASNASGSDTESIDMGDYENRIRPSSAFWRKKDGLSLAEKIIFYRNWKYRNFPRREDNHQTVGDMESTLADHRLLRSNRHAAKSAATPRRRNSLEDDRQRPVTVIPKVTDTVTFPPIDTGRKVAATTSPHHDEERERLPSIERNQFVSRSRSPKEDNELEEYDKKDDEEEEGIAETEIDEKDKDEDNGDKPDDQDDKPDDEPDNANDVDKQDVVPVAASNQKSKKRRPKIPRVSGPRAPRPTGEPDKLIAKLNKKVERDLRTLQGQPSKRDSDDDDDDTDVDDDTMNDILHGERGKQLDSFLQAA